MTYVEITLKIPETLASDAEEFDALNDEVFVKLLQKEVERRVMAFVNDEVHAYRAEKAAASRQPPDKSS